MLQACGVALSYAVRGCRSVMVSMCLVRLGGARLELREL
jgi:hypothetical protein